MADIRRLNLGLIVQKKVFPIMPEGEVREIDVVEHCDARRVVSRVTFEPWFSSLKDMTAKNQHQ